MRSLAIVALPALLACSHPPDAPPPAAPARNEPAPAAPDAPAAPPAGSPTATSSTVVVARVVTSGPIGSGRCTQCSHQVVVEERLSGEIAAGQAPLWVHFEHCAGEPPPARPEGTVDPCSLESGSAYELTLRPGGSPNFGDAPMILTASPR